MNQVLGIHIDQIIGKQIHAVVAGKNVVVGKFAYKSRIVVFLVYVAQTQVGIW